MAKGVSGYIYRKGASPNTSLLNTQRVRLFGYDVEEQAVTQIGLIQTWNPTQSRTVEPVRGIGFGDQIAELAVGVTELTASCTIVMMYVRDMFQIFGYKAGSSGLVRSLKHHRWPFDIREDILVPTIGGQTVTTGSPIRTSYEACWFTDYSKAFNIGDTMVTQDASMSITDVFDPSQESANAEDMPDTGGTSKIYGFTA